MRFGPRNVLIPGMALVAAALLLFARTPVDGQYLSDLLPPLLLMGIGIGISFSSLMTLAMSGATPSDAGLASGVVNTSAQVGGAIGLAVLATLAAERTSTLEDGGASVSAALNSGFHLAYLVAAGLVGVALAIAIFVLRSVPMPDPAAMAEAAPGEEPQGAPEPAYSEVG
jgi:MFS family permease